MNEMTFSLRTDGTKCLYEQIYEHIKREIRTGKLLSGEKLPSARFLAEYLQVARTTVDYAYGQLLSEGYIESKPCRGYYVCPMEELFQLEADGYLEGDSWHAAARGGAETRLGGERQRAAGAAEPGEAETLPGGKRERAAGAEVRGRAEIRPGAAVRRGGMAGGGERPGEAPARENAAVRQHITKTAAGGGFRADFSPYDIDMSGFPFQIWKKITKNILTYANSDLFAKGETQGDYELRETIVKYLHASRGVECRPEQIIVGAGNDYLLMLLEKILGRHVRIAMENPTYIRSYKIFRSFGYRITTVDMDEAGMQADKLNAAKTDIAYVMPSHQFPTGIVMPIGRRLELLKWADSGEGRYLIEDDYDSEFRFHGKPIPALQASDGHGRVIYIGTFSKAIAPAIRVSFMVLPQMLLERYLADCSFYSCTVSRIDQRILNEFIRDGYFERHLNKMRKLYRGKHEMLLECLQPLRKDFIVSGENAGLHLLLTSKRGIPERTLIERAASLGVRVYGLSESMVEDAPDSAAVLLGFGGLSEEGIQQGTAMLRKAWQTGEGR